jgi:hypothetical protein
MNQSPDGAFPRLEVQAMEHHTEVTPDEARGGIKLGVMRYVLGFGIAGIVIAFLATYFLT